MLEYEVIKGKRIDNKISDYVVVDIETTGLSPKNNKIIEIAAVKVSNNEVVGTFSKLVNPEERLNFYISRLTGITDNMLKGEKTIDSVIEEFNEFLGNSIILGHNVNFDINFLYHNLYSVKGLHLSNDYIDTMHLGRKVVPGLPNYKLESLTKHFNVGYEGAHRALNDCMFTYECYEKMKNMF